MSLKASLRSFQRKEGPSPHICHLATKECKYLSWGSHMGVRLFQSKSIHQANLSASRWRERTTIYDSQNVIHLHTLLKGACISPSEECLRHKATWERSPLHWSNLAPRSPQPSHRAKGPRDPASIACHSLGRWRLKNDQQGVKHTGCHQQDLRTSVTVVISRLDRFWVPWIPSCLMIHLPQGRF